MGEKFIYSIGDGISSNSPLLDKCYFKNQKLTAVKSKWKLCGGSYKWISLKIDSKGEESYNLFDEMYVEFAVISHTDWIWNNKLSNFLKEFKLEFEEIWKKSLKMIISEKVNGFDVRCVMMQKSR